MRTRLGPGVVNRDRRQLSITTAMGIAAAVAAGTILATSAVAQSARDIRDPSPYVAVQNEPAPKLIVDPPLPEGGWPGAVLVNNREICKIAPYRRPQRRKSSP